MPAMTIASTMHVSVREARLFTDRLLMLTALELGLVAGVREFILHAELVGAGGFQFVHDEVLTRSSVPTPHLDLSSRDVGVMKVDCDGQLAGFVGPLLLDQVTLEARRGVAMFEITNVRYPGLLRAIPLLANRRGVMTTVVTPLGSRSFGTAVGAGSTTGPALIGELEPAAPTETDWIGTEHVLVLAVPVGSATRPASTPAESGIGVELRNVLSDGFEVESELWWKLYHRSNDALTRTSPISRTHTGADDTLEVTW